MNPTRSRQASLLPSLTTLLHAKIRSPLAVVLGSPGEVANLVTALPAPAVTCYQMDQYPADRLTELLRDAASPATVALAPDLWDLPGNYASAVYLAARGGERELKLDMIEQGYHILRPQGLFLVVSPHVPDLLFPNQLKKVFGRVHATITAEASLFWCRREGERPRRRHEVTFQCRIGDHGSLRFLSRPGVFSYGRLDDGARALIESMEIEPGNRILDLGCGCGTNGICAALTAGAEGQVTFVDSNLRAIALTEINARANGLSRFQTIVSHRIDELPPASFDVVLANPPYYAQATIAEHFIDRAQAMLRPDGRLYLVTKQADQVAPFLTKRFADVEAQERRGYLVFQARADGG